MSEQELIAKLKHIDEALQKLEESAENIIKHKFTDAYWIGRKEALADLREAIGSQLEGIKDGRAAKATDSSKTQTTST